MLLRVAQGLQSATQYLGRLEHKNRAASEALSEVPNGNSGGGDDYGQSGNGGEVVELFFWQKNTWRVDLYKWEWQMRLEARFLGSF